jgi:hypothetical protein
MTKRIWRIFAIVNGAGVVCFTFGSLEGAMRTALLEVGGLLLLPASLLMAPVGIAFNFGGHHFVSERVSQFVAALVVAGVNCAVWFWASRSIRAWKSADSSS